MSIRLYTNASSAARRVDLNTRMSLTVEVVYLRPQFERVAIHQNPAHCEYTVSYLCKCGASGWISVGEFDIRAAVHPVYAVIEELDKRHHCGSGAVELLCHILEVVSRCLYEEVVDDTMKRFSLLELE